MRNEAAYQVLLDFLRKEYSSENALFLRAVWAFSERATKLERELAGAGVEEWLPAGIEAEEAGNEMTKRSGKTCSVRQWWWGEHGTDLLGKFHRVQYWHRRWKTSTSGVLAPTVQGRLT